MPGRDGLEPRTLWKPFEPHQLLAIVREVLG